MRRFVCVFGHSHIHALREAYQRELSNSASNSDVEFRFVPIPPTQNVFVREGEMLFLAPEIQEAIRAGVDRDVQPVYVSLIGGNAHNTLGLIENPVPFDFFLPDQLNTQVNKTVAFLPYAFVLDCLEHRLFTHVNMIRCARGHFTGRMIHIESPPPIKDNNYIAGNLDRFFKENFPNGKVADPVLRYKLWRVHSTIIERACRENSIEFVSAPKEAQSIDGFLLPDFCTNNATHANAKYGGLVLKQIASMLDE